MVFQKTTDSAIARCCLLCYFSMFGQATLHMKWVKIGFILLMNNIVVCAGRIRSVDRVGNVSRNDTRRSSRETVRAAAHPSHGTNVQSASGVVRWEARAAPTAAVHDSAGPPHIKPFQCTAISLFQNKTHAEIA